MINYNSMVQIAVKLDDELKNLVTIKAKKDGLTISFLINFFLRNYAQWKIWVWVVSQFTENLEFTDTVRQHRDEALSDFAEWRNFFTIDELQQKYG